MFESKAVKLLTTSLPFLLKGALLTLQVALCAMVIGLTFGLLFGIISSKNLKVKGVSQLIGLYVLIIRGTPVYVQILICYYALPDLLGINLSPFAAGVLALGCNSIAYVTEIVSSGINAISQGQWKASYALGYGAVATHWYIILPQALRNPEQQAR